MRIYIIEPNTNLPTGFYLDLGPDNQGNAIISIIEGDTGLEIDLSPSDTDRFLNELAGMHFAYEKMKRSKQDSVKDLPRS